MGLHRAINGAMRRLSFSAPEDTDETLSALAERWGVSKSQVVNILIDQGLSVEVLKEGGGEILYRHPESGTHVVFSPGVDRIADPSEFLPPSDTAH